MSKKSLIAIFVIVAILVLYSLSTATATVNPRGKYHSIKGGEVGGAQQWTTIPTLISDLNLAWARIPVKWRDAVVVNHSTYEQTLNLASGYEYDKFLTAVKAAQGMGAEVIVTVKGVPDDYKESASAGTDPNGNPVYWPNYCGRISTNRIGKLGEFIKLMLDNLNTQSIQIRYIELWNEPDVEAGKSAPSIFGCWAKIPSTAMPTATVMSDVGAYYAQVLNTVAPYVKRYYPNVKFIAGAAREPHSGFLDQVIEDAWSNIDVLSYHRYVTSYDLNCEIPHYLSTQQSGFGYVRNALNTRTANDIVAGMATPTPKPILISEGAMKYGNAELNPPPPAFYDCQAKYARNLLTWLKVQATPGSLKGFIWYTVGFNGWYYTDLLNMDTPTPTPTRRNYVNLVATPTPTPKYTPMPVYFVWKDWVPPVFVPLLVNNYHFDNSPYSGMSVSGQSESGAYPAPLDDSAPGIDQPPDQNNQAPYPAPDLMEDSASGVDMPLEQYTPTPPITPFPTETPTPDIDPALEQYSPTSYPTPAL